MYKGIMEKQAEVTIPSALRTMLEDLGRRLSRIEAALRDGPRPVPETDTFAFGDGRVNRRRFAFIGRKNEFVRLSPRELTLLEIFAEHPHVMGNFMFCFTDAAVCWHCHHENCPAECYWGLCDVNCVPKKAYYAARDAVRRLYF